MGVKPMGMRSRGVHSPRGGAGPVASTAIPPTPPLPPTPHRLDADGRRRLDRSGPSARGVRVGDEGFGGPFPAPRFF